MLDALAAAAAPPAGPQGASLQEPPAAPKARPSTGSLTNGSEGVPPRPMPDEKTIQFTRTWLEDITNLPDHRTMEDVAKRINQELVPAWSDPNDPSKGHKNRGVRTGADDRRVNTPLAYLNVQQIVATTVPENHKVRWKPDQLANPTHLGPDKDLVAYGRSIATICEKYTREIQWQDRLEAWVQEACIYPIGIVKLFFERDTTNEPVTDGAREDVDGQDQRDRIQQILQDLAANRIQKDDARVVELQDLLANQGETAEVEVRSGLVLQSVPITQFRLPRSARILEDVYLSPWMGQDVEMSRKDIRKSFPYKITGENEWTGIHPDDLKEAKSSTLADVRSPGKKQARKADRGGMDSKQGVQTDDETLVVHEVWDRESGYVMVFLCGVDYPIAKWKPEKTPAQWFPYHLMVLERLPGQVAGISKIELQMDEQARINRKRSDEEKARYHSQPKGICDSTYWTDDKQSRTVNIKPYTLKGLELGGNKLADVVQWFSTPMQPAAYDTSQDRQDLNRAANVSSQSLGVTGEADFAAEVDLAAQGTAISSQAVKNRIRRGLERLYDAVAQTLQQEVTHDEAIELDPTVVFPKVYSDAEADQLYAQIRKEVRAGLLPQILQPYAAMPDPVTGAMTPAQPMPPPAELERQLYEQAEPLVQERCLQTFGVPKPLSRETLYRRLRVHVTVALDAQVDRNKRLNALMKLFEAAAQMVTAASAAGMRIDLIPLMKQLAPLIEADEDLVDEMFSPDPNATAAMLLQTLAEGGAMDPTLAAPLVQAIVAAAAQAVPAPAKGGGKTAPAAPSPTTSAPADEVAAEQAA